MQTQNEQGENLQDHINPFAVLESHLGWNSKQDFQFKMEVGLDRSSAAKVIRVRPRHAASKRP